MLDAVFVTMAVLTLSPTPHSSRPSPSAAPSVRSPAPSQTMANTRATALSSSASPRSPAQTSAKARERATTGAHVSAATAAASHAPAAQEPLAVPGGVADPNALYSIRARKRFAAYLRLRLLELREEHLSRAAEAIERHISVSELLQNP